MLPVVPAAMTGPGGGARRQASAWASSTRLRRSAGSRQPSSANTRGQCSVRMFRNSRVICQWRAYSSGTNCASRSSASRSVCTWSISRASAAASRAAWSGWRGPSGWVAPHLSTSRVNRSCRRSGGIAGATSSPMPGPASSPAPGVNSSMSRSPSGISRGNSSGRPWVRRRNASAKALRARRVGSNTVKAASAVGSGPAWSSRPAARVSTKGSPGAMA